MYNVFSRIPEPILSADLHKVPGQLDLAAVFSFAFLCADDLTPSQGFVQALSAPDENKVSCMTWKFSLHTWPKRNH